jgi:hypothetical protein
MGETESAAQTPAADEEEKSAASPAPSAPAPETTVVPDEEAKVPGPQYDA